jgi:uncharacterized DUF497 family protein
MEFEWDEAKNRANLAKHGFDFTYAIRIFAGEVREQVDPRPWNEDQVAATGIVDDRFVTVIYTVRGDRYRVISARPARRRERF